MRNIKSPLKQLEYASKLKLVDNHLSRRESNQHLVNMEYQQILKMMALKLTFDPPQEILPLIAKTVIFDTFDTRNFIIREQVAPKGKNYILNVNTYAHLKLEIKINDRSPKFYAFQGNKAIQIFEQSFSDINIVATVIKMGIFSSVKFYLDFIQVQHTSPKKININLRPNIDKQLEEYLSKNRGKSAQIIRNRSLVKSRQFFSRKTLSNFKQQQPVKNIDLVRSKSQYQHFERKKSLYIKHVRKMSPSKVKILEENEEKYHITKKQQLAKLSVLIYIAKLSRKVYQSRIKQSALRLKEMKVIFLCLQFIKIIKNKFRLKMTEKARLRMCLHHTMQFIPLVQRDSNVNKAKMVLLEILTPFMDYRMIEELGKNSEDYLSAIRKIQSFARMKSSNLRKRIQFLIQKMLIQNKIVCTQQKKHKVIEHFVKCCIKYGGNVTKIYLKQDQLTLMLRKSDEF